MFILLVNKQKEQNRTHQAKSQKMSLYNFQGVPREHRHNNFSALFQILNMKYKNKPLI